MLTGANEERRTRIVSLIIRYGWHGLSALQRLLDDDEKETFYRDYTATMQKHLVDLLGRFITGDGWQSMPSYLEMAHEGADLPKQNTQQTNEEAKAHVYKIFGITPPERG